jgi:predicted membrane-bound dolichyl-phosphate-mannose-protein mannosyltransferase
MSNLELKLELISFTPRNLTNYDKPTLPHEANSLDVDDNVLIQINTILDIYIIFFSFLFIYYRLVHF